MGKGDKQKSNKEIKKPKKDKSKPAAATTASTRDSATVAGKKIS